MSVMKDQGDMATSGAMSLPPIARQKRLRLLKVICQPVFILDDGEALAEQAADPIVVTAAQWPTYATTLFAANFEALRRQVEGDER